MAARGGNQRRRSLPDRLPARRGDVTPPPPPRRPEGLENAVDDAVAPLAQQNNVVHDQQQHVENVNPDPPGIENRNLPAGEIAGAQAPVQVQQQPNAFVPGPPAPLLAGQQFAQGNGMYPAAPPYPAGYMYGGYPAMYPGCNYGYQGYLPPPPPMPQAAGQAIAPRGPPLPVMPPAVQPPPPRAPPIQPAAAREPQIAPVAPIDPPLPAGEPQRPLAPALAPVIPPPPPEVVQPACNSAAEDMEANRDLANTVPKDTDSEVIQRLKSLLKRAIDRYKSVRKLIHGLELQLEYIQNEQQLHQENYNYRNNNNNNRNNSNSNNNNNNSKSSNNWTNNNKRFRKF